MFMVIYFKLISFLGLLPYIKCNLTRHEMNVAVKKRHSYRTLSVRLQLVWFRQENYLVRFRKTRLGKSIYINYVNSVTKIQILRT